MKRAIVVLGSFVLVLAVILIVISRHQSERDLPAILEDGRLTVLINSGEHGFTRDTAKVGGFQYEVIKKYADELGVELVIVHEPDHEAGNEELLRGDCDVIVSLQPMIFDSASAVVSLYPLVESNLMLVQLADSSGSLTIKKQYELDGKKITLTKASPFRPLLEQLSDDLAIEPVFIESNFTNIDLIISKVVSGEIEYAVCPAHLTARIKSKYPQVDLSLPLTFHLPLGWTVRAKAVQLKESLNAFLSNFVGTADYWTLYASYFSEN